MKVELSHLELIQLQVRHGIPAPRLPVPSATYGIASPKFPDRAALVLENDPKSGEDGLLQVREIRDLNLAADLVTLSACDTGVGALEGEEGIANLVRAFVFAGAKSVVASLWAASSTYTVTLTRGLRPQPTTGVLFPDRRFETGIVTSPPVNQQSSIINRQSNGHAILLGWLLHVRRRVEEHSTFSERAKLGYSSLSVNVDW
jgi:hypothetical protein